MPWPGGEINKRVLSPNALVIPWYWIQKKTTNYQQQQNYCHWLFVRISIRSLVAVLNSLHYIFHFPLNFRYASAFSWNVNDFSFSFPFPRKPLQVSVLVWMTTGVKGYCRCKIIKKGKGTNALDNFFKVIIIIIMVHGLGFCFLFPYCLQVSIRKHTKSTLEMGEATTK